eukprot:Awhi_evm1s13546
MVFGNQDETDIDCGGDICAACPSCDDGLHNQDETGIDCGGSICAACPTCDDGLQNQDETDIDCGGGSCGPCTPKCPFYTNINGDLCWTTPNYPANYNNDDNCVINMQGDGRINVRSFNIEEYYDRLTSDDTWYSHIGIGLNGTNVLKGDQFTFTSDYMVTKPGFDLCLT